MVTPFAPSAAWMAEMLRQEAEGQDSLQSRLAANRLCGIEGKDFARCEIEGRRLTVPVEGGGSQLKRRLASPMLSEHGKWQREHLGAWNAAYGRTPFYPHLMPMLEEVYAEADGSMPLEEFNSRLLLAAIDWLDYQDVAADRERLADFINAYKKRVAPQLSIFDLIFRYGKDSVFALF